MKTNPWSFTGLFFLFAYFYPFCAQAHDLYICHPHPLLADEWKITVQQNGTNYHLKTSYLPQNSLGASIEHVLAARRTEEGQSENFKADGCEIDVYPNEIIYLGSDYAFRAFVPHCVFTGNANLNNQEYYCLPLTM